MNNFKRKQHGAWVRKEVMCPDCYTDQTIKWRKGVSRFKAREYPCRNPNCDFRGSRGEFDD